MITFKTESLKSSGLTSVILLWAHALPFFYIYIHAVVRMQMGTGVVRLLCLHAAKAEKKDRFSFQHISSHKISNVISVLFNSSVHTYVYTISSFVFVLLCICMKQRDLYNLCRVSESDAFVCLRGARNTIHWEFSSKETASATLRERNASYFLNTTESSYVFCSAALMSSTTSLICVNRVQQIGGVEASRCSFGAICGQRNEGEMKSVLMNNWWWILFFSACLFCFVLFSFFV